MQWCCETNLFAIEALAELLGIELGAVEVPDIDVSPVATTHEHLVRSLRTADPVDEFAAYRMRIAFRLARHLLRFDQIGREVTDADLDDLHALLGHRPAGWQDGDADLERYVLDDDGRHDEQLVTLFHRRLSRAQMLLGPAGSAMTRHLPSSRSAERAGQLPNSMPNGSLRLNGHPVGAARPPAAPRRPPPLLLDAVTMAKGWNRWT